MQNAGQQYGQGGASSHQTAPFGSHSETTTTASITSSLRQFRRKNEEKPSHSDNNTSSAPTESHVARVAPHSHYPPRSTAECYRYPPQYPDYGLQQPVKYSEISEPHPSLQEHISASVIQKAKSKEYMDMCNVQQQHMKPTYDHLNGQQPYPDANVHPHPQYLHKEPQGHPVYKPESQYYPKDPQYSPQVTHQIPKYNMPPAQVRKYPPENDFLSKLRRIHPTMARSIMSDHHLQESQGSYQNMDQSRMYPHHQNQRYMNYPNGMQNSGYSHGYMPYSNYPASCSYNRPPQVTPRFPSVNPHERSISPRRGYSDNGGHPMNYGSMPVQKMPPNYPQYNAPEYAQHYQHRRVAMTQEYYQQHCGPAQFLPPHQMPPQEMSEGRVTVSDNIKHYIENWADEETASEMNQMESSRLCKEPMRGRDDHSTETVYMINASELQYLENGILTSENGMPVPVVTSESGQYIIKSGVSIENGSGMVRIVEKSSHLEIDPATGERVVNLHIMDTPSKPDCMLANKPNETNQRQPTEHPNTVPDKPRVIVHQNTVITSGVQNRNVTRDPLQTIDESIKIGTSLPIISEALEELNRSIINECRKETADKNCSPINLDQMEQYKEQEASATPVKSSADCLLKEIASIQEMPDSPKNIPLEDAHVTTKTENEERQIAKSELGDPDIETYLDDTVNNTEAIEPQIENNTRTEIDENICKEETTKEKITDISKEENLVTEETVNNETEQQPISSDNLSEGITQTSINKEDNEDTKTGSKKCTVKQNSTSNNGKTTEEIEVGGITVNKEAASVENNVSPIDLKIAKSNEKNNQPYKPSVALKTERITTKRSRRIFSVDDIINNIGKKLRRTETENLSRRYSLKTTQEFLAMESKNIFKFIEPAPEKSCNEDEGETEALADSNELELAKSKINNVKQSELVAEKTEAANEVPNEEANTIKCTTEESSQEIINDTQSKHEEDEEATKKEPDNKPETLIEREESVEEKLPPNKIIHCEEQAESSSTPNKMKKGEEEKELEEKNVFDENELEDKNILDEKEETPYSEQSPNLPEEIIFDSDDIVSQEPIIATEEEIVFESKDADDSQEETTISSAEVILASTDVELPVTISQPPETCEISDESSVLNIADLKENLIGPSEVCCILKETTEVVDTSEDIPIISVESKVPEQPEVQYRNVIRVEDSSVLLEIAGELVEINVNSVNGKNIITLVPLSDTAVVDCNDNYETFDNAAASDPLNLDEAPQEQEEQEHFAEDVDVDIVEAPEPEVVETTSEIIIGMDLSLEEEIKLDLDQPPVLCTKAAKKAYDCDLQIPSITTSEDVLDNNRFETLYNSNDKVSSTKEKTTKVKRTSKPDSSRRSEVPKRMASKPDKKSLFRDLIAARNRKKVKVEVNDVEEDDFVPFKELVKARKLRKNKLKQMKINEDSKVDSTIKIDETNKQIEVFQEIDDDQISTDTITETVQQITNTEERTKPKKLEATEKTSEETANLENAVEKVEHKIVKRVSFSDLREEIEPVKEPTLEVQMTEEKVAEEVVQYKLEDPRLSKCNGGLSKATHSKKKLSLEEYNRRKRKIQEAAKVNHTEVKKTKIDRHHSAVEPSTNNPEKVKMHRPKSLDDINLLKTKETPSKRKLSLEYSPVQQNHFDWEETQSPKVNLNRKDPDNKVCEFRGLIAENHKNKPHIVIDVNDFNYRPSTESSEDEILQNYKEQVESKLSTLNIQIPRPAKSLERHVADPFSRPETNRLIERFLKNDKLSAEEMEKIKKIISYKRLMQQLKKSHDLSRTAAPLKPAYEVRKELGEKRTKLLLKKVSEKKKSRFRNLYSRSQSESETDYREKPKCSGDYSVVQSNCLAGVVPKLIIKRKTEMPLPFVRLERLDLGLLDEKNGKYAV